MIHQLIIAGVCILLGASFRLLFVLTSFIEKKTKLIPVTIIMDIILGGIIVSSYALFMLLFNDGMFPIYTFFALATGYTAIYAFI